ncbi:MAG: transposase [Thaumarchaeota archaeon]|jgi:transposase|nr:transposase [Nitrososphaerota archaeon]
MDREILYILHFLPFRKLHKIIEYKAKLKRVKVIYVNPKNTFKTCHRYMYVIQTESREFKSPKCGLFYNHNLNTSIKIDMP